MHLCREVRIPLNGYPIYHFKQSDEGAAAMLELWEMWSTPSLPSHLDPLLLGVVATGRVLSMVQIDLLDI